MADAKETKETEVKQEATKQGEGLDPKIAGLLSWLIAPIGSIIVLVTNKDEFSKFHAWQSLIWTVVGFVIATVMTFSIILSCVAWLPLVVNIVGAIKAYQGEWWELPVIGEFARKQAKS